MQDFIENTDLKDIQQLREAQRRQEELENETESRQFHATYGSDEAIYEKAREAAKDYLAELGVEDESDDEDEGPEERKEMTDEDWDDAPGTLLATCTDTVNKCNS